MTTKQHKFTPQAILVRALAYGILVYLKEDELVVEAPDDLDASKRDKALEVIEASKQNIIAYLQESLRDVLEQARLHPEICCICLDQDKETRALPDDCDGWKE